MSNRKIVEKEILYFIDKFRPGSNNRTIYEEMFKGMDDKAFADFMKDLENGESLVLYAPNLEKPTLSVRTNLMIAKELGVELRQHLYLTDPHTGQVKKTANKYLVGDAVTRRQAQTLDDKSSIPRSGGSIDQRTGQFSARENRGARFSGPELNVNVSKGLNKMIIETIKYKGGDERGYNLFKQSIYNTGEVSIDYLKSNFDTTVKSTKTLSIYLKAMHLQNNLI